VTRFVLRRLLQLPLVLLGISAIVFGSIAFLPGDPALTLLGPQATPERAEALRRELGLEAPLPLRYARWLSQVAQGDLGRSFSRERPVADVVVERAGATALLAGTAFVLATVLGLVAGTLAAGAVGRWPDRVLTLGAVAGLATPPYWLAVLAILAFAVGLGWLPVSGMRSTLGEGGAADVARHLVLPACTLATVAAAVIARVTRTSVLEASGQEFVRVARAKGLSERRVLWAHGFRAGVVGVVPVVGLQAGYVLGGAVYVETVFQWPGLGRMLVEAIAARDLLLMQGGTLVLASAYVLVNLAADVTQALLDRRIAP